LMSDPRKWWCFLFEYFGWINVRYPTRSIFWRLRYSFFFILTRYH
jgi:hypothetical protein